MSEVFEVRSTDVDCARGTFDSRRPMGSNHTVGIADTTAGAEMRDFSSSSPAVVVGIDGSRSAVAAALWAVDEGGSRDIPLRLVCAVDPGQHIRHRSSGRRSGPSDCRRSWSVRV